MINTPPSLQGDVQIRVAANGFIATYRSLEYVFLDVKSLNNWIVLISSGG